MKQLLSDSSILLCKKLKIFLDFILVERIFNYSELRIQCQRLEFAQGWLQDMSKKVFNTSHMSGLVPQLFPCIGPALMIAMGYIDLGKWVAAFEVGASFGFDFVLLLVMFNCTAIFCQYLATCIAISTRKNLAQICKEEYCRLTCIFLGVQAQLSMVISDLTSILGIAHGLNLLFAVDLCTCIYLAAVGAVLFSLTATVLGNCKAELLNISISGFALIFYVFGVLVSQPEVPLSMNGIFPRFSGESACSLMALLGANIMPHNFYIHSSIVQQQRKIPNVSMGALSHDHFFAVLFILSGIFLVNYVLIISAAAVFDGSSHGLTFQEVFLLLNQIFRSPISPIALFLVLFFTSQITAMTWNLGRQVIWHDFFGINQLFLVHHVVIKLLAIIPALYCAWSGGAEGIYRLLVFSQVISAMLLPSSVIPLFRVASSKLIMGAFKISWRLEILALSAFLGLVASNILFISEMLFGNSSWLVSLRGNKGNSVTLQFILLLLIASISLGLTLYLAITPLKSTIDGQDMQLWAWYLQKNLPEISEGRVENDLNKMRYDEDQESTIEPATEKSTEGQSDNAVSQFNLNLPETNIDSNYHSHQSVHGLMRTAACTSLPTHPEESKSLVKSHPKESKYVVEVSPLETVGKASNDSTVDAGNLLRIKAKQPVARDVPIEADVHVEDAAEEGDLSEPDELESSRRALPTSRSSKNPQRKGDNSGNGSGKPSKLPGLGRSVRRQFAEILNEFWGQLFDTYGELTVEANTNRVGVLLGLDSTTTRSLAKVDRNAYGSPNGFPEAEAGPVLFMNSMDHGSSNQQRIQNIDSSYGAPPGSSAWSSNTQLLDAYTQSSCTNNFAIIEGCYYGSYQSQFSDCLDYQPATIHRYQIHSHHGRIANRDAELSSRISVDLPPNTKSVVPFIPNYSDPSTFILGHYELGSPCVSGLQNTTVSRIGGLQVETPCYESSLVETSENVASSPHTKNYHSLPKSSLSLPVSLNIEEKSLWSKQPFEQLFGMAGKAQNSRFEGTSNGPSIGFEGKTPSHGDSEAELFEQLLDIAGTAQNGRDEGASNGLSMAPEQKPSHTESEAMLLQSLRFCIAKLLKLEGSDWLFSQKGGSDEELIDRVAAARERILYEADSGEINGIPDQKFITSEKSEEADIGNPLSLMSNCGDRCAWRAGLILSFGVWCIRRISEMLVAEVRPEMWGKYTYVFNRLQGIIDPAFRKHRAVLFPCQCLEIPGAHGTLPSLQQRNGLRAAEEAPGRRRCTTANMAIELIKRAEAAVSGRKGRAGTKAAERAYRLGKDNLLSVIKRIKRRLSNCSPGRAQGVGSSSSSLLRKVPLPAQ